MSKPLTLFDHLSGITDKKTPWEKLSDADRKSFGCYMINRFLSMNQDLTEVVDQLQPYTCNLLSPEMVYKLYSDILPKNKIFFRYIKNKKEGKYNSDLVELLSKHFEIASNEVIDYLDIIFQSDSLKDELEGLLAGYANDKKQVKKLMKIE